MTHLGQSRLNQGHDTFVTKGPSILFNILSFYFSVIIMVHLMTRKRSAQLCSVTIEVDGEEARYEGGGSRPPNNQR